MSRLRQFVLGLVLALAFVAPARSATLLLNGEQTFVDANGQPLAGGTVQFDIPNTTTPKTTWLDPGQATPNTNPVVLDSAGRAIIYGSGSYRQIVKDQFGNLVWDQLTADGTGSNANWGGTTSGSANAPTLTASGFSGNAGQQLIWLNAFTNTGATTLTVNGVGYSVFKDTPSGPVTLTGGELGAGDVSQAIYDGTALHLITNNVGGTLTALSGATTTNLGTVPSHNVLVNGSATITSFGSSANTDYPRYNLTFGGASILTNSAALALPNGVNLTTESGGTAIAVYSGSGNWTLTNYWHPNGAPANLAGTGAGAAGSIPYYSAPQAVALLAAGVSGSTLQLCGSTPCWGTASISNYQSFTANGTWTKPTGVTANSITYARCWGGGGGGGANATGGGGGGGGFSENWFTTSDNNPKTVSISIASPAVVTFNQNYKAGQTIQFQTTGSLPSGITAGQNYYIISNGLSTSSFEFSATVGGSAINTTGSQGGTQTITAGLGATETVTIGAGGAAGSAGGITSFGNWVLAGAGGTAGTGAASGGGGGGGSGVAGIATGSISGANGSTTTPGLGGGVGVVDSGGDSSFGGGIGGAGGGSSSTNAEALGSGEGGGGGGGGVTGSNLGGNGGASLWGGGGGAGGGASGSGNAGQSAYGGNGGAATVAGSPPGGGGGRNAAGANGECDVWTSG